MTIPTVLTSFVGRQRELEDVGQALRSARLVTLTGPAGCGKTRLAKGVADGAGNQYADGIHWVELARLADPRFVLPAVARPLNVDESAGRSLEQGLPEVLQKISLLLATSREPLGLQPAFGPGPDRKRGLSTILL